MKRVFIVYESDYTFSAIRGVFWSESDATALAKKLRQAEVDSRAGRDVQQNFTVEWLVEEFEVQ
jgi:hypothetical protein